ncbi:MAG: methionyl-tRNA formyltransferase [Gemmataceae bacterium]
MRVVMMGTGIFAEPTLEMLLQRPGLCVGLFTQPDRDTGERRGSTRQTGRGMKTIAQAHGLPVYQPESINTPEGVALLAGLQPDLCVIAAYGQILKPEVLAVPPLGCINVHASLLPKYRGAAPINWAIYHGETETGVTIFQLTTGVDTGDILAQTRIAIGPEDTAGDIEARLAPLGARLALECIDALASGTATRTKQDDSLASRAPKLKKEDGQIDWTRSAAQINAHVRAMQPWPTAYTYWRRSGTEPLRLIVQKTRVTDLTTHEQPGTILNHLECLRVAVGQGQILEVLDLQPAGKPRMSAADFLRGRRWQPGDTLGANA